MKARGWIKQNLISKSTESFSAITLPKIKEMIKQLTETSVPQQASSFIIKCYFGISNITACKKKSCFLLVHCQTIDVQSCFTVPRHAFLIGFSITISELWIPNWVLVEFLETISKLCTLYLPYSSNDNFLSPVLVSDWLILCWGSLILHQTKKQK